MLETDPLRTMLLISIVGSSRKLIQRLDLDVPTVNVAPEKVSSWSSARSAQTQMSAVKKTTTAIFLNLIFPHIIFALVFPRSLKFMRARLSDTLLIHPYRCSGSAAR